MAECSGHDSSIVNALFEEFVSKARDSLSEGLLTKQIAERCKRRIEPRVLRSVGALRGAESLDRFKTEAKARLDPGSWDLDSASIIQEEVQRVAEAKSGSEHLLLSLIPGKALLPIAASVLNLDVTAYKRMVTGALSSKKTDMLQMRNQLEAALGDHLPPRVQLQAGAPLAAASPRQAT